MTESENFLKEKHHFKVHYLHRSERSIKNWLHFKHDHPFAEIFLITGGEGEFLIENETLPVRVNDIIYIHPKIEHTELSTYDAPLEYFVLGIDGFAIKAENEEHTPYLLFNDTNRESAFYFYQGFDEFTKKEQNSEKILYNLMECLLLWFERKQKVNLKARKVSNYSHLSMLVRNYLDANYREILTLEEVATAFHVSKYHLSHSFKKDFGISPIKYLNILRVEQAKFLLATSNYSVLDITDSLGFSSQSYFAQIFKKTTGISPAQFRKQRREKLPE